MVDSKKIQEYNKIRQVSARGLLCHAPFTNLNFEQNGNITACCYNRTYVLGKYPANTIEQAWFGAKADQLRQYIRNKDLSGGCSACEQLLNSGNYSGTKAIFYDEYADNIPWATQLKRKIFNERAYPKVFEFELTNTCNLECTMCNGYFSSAIRKNREHLPEVKVPFDDNFIQQVKSFIPYLTDAKFLGGEPFLIDLYYKIWDAIIEINPKVKAHITTNGTILNGRVKDYLEKLNCGVVVSLDSLDKTNYEKIRVNASFDRVLSNIHYFIDWARRKNTYFSIAACPIRENWMDLPELLRFCNQHNIYLHFNTVWTPESSSLRFLNMREFAEVISFLEQNEVKNPQTAAQIQNTANYRGVINQIKYWSQSGDKYYQFFPKFSSSEFRELPIAETNILLAEFVHYHKKNGDDGTPLAMQLLEGEECLVQTDRGLEENLQNVRGRMSDSEFLKAFCSSLSLYGSKILPQAAVLPFKSKSEALHAKFETVADKPELISELIGTDFIYLFELVQSQDMETLHSLVDGRFKHG